MIFFVGGTDTGVGKTSISAALLDLLPSFRYWKPVQTGSDSDTETVKAATGLSPEHFFPPAYEFAQPLSPHLAAKLDGARVETEKIQLPVSERLIVEGAGGLLVPYNDFELQLDWVKSRELPLLLVTEDRVGAINQVLLSLEAAQSRKVEILGVILNKHRQEVGNQQTLQKWTGLPVWKVPFSTEKFPSLRSTGIELQLTRY